MAHESNHDLHSLLLRNKQPSECCAGSLPQMQSVCQLAPSVRPVPCGNPRRLVQRAQSRIRALPTFPRILEELPIRRLTARQDNGGLFDLTSKELTRILSPTAGTTPELLTGTSLLLAVISIAVDLEFLQRSFQSVPEPPLPGDYSQHGRKDDRHNIQDTRAVTTAHQEKLLRRQVIN